MEDTCFSRKKGVVASVAAGVRAEVYFVRNSLNAFVGGRGGATSEDMMLIIELTGQFTLTRCCFLLTGNDEREVNITSGDHWKRSQWKRRKAGCSICYKEGRGFSTLKESHLYFSVS